MTLTTELAAPELARLVRLGAVLDAVAELPLVWTVGAAIGLIALLIVVMLVARRVRRRQRVELYTSALDAIETLLVVPVTADAPRTDAEASADEIVAAGDEARDALTELERCSRSEMAAAANMLRRHTAELAANLEARARGEGDPYLLDVRVTELRERVRGARDRLDAAVRA